MQTQTPSPWKQAVSAGLIGGVVAVLMSLVGMVAAFKERFIVSGMFTMSQILFLAPLLLFAYSAIRRTAPQPAHKIISIGSLSGLVGSAFLAVLVIIGKFVNLRIMFVNASPELYGILTFNQESVLGLLLLLIMGVVIGAVAGGVFLLPQRVRTALGQATIWVWFARCS